MADVSRIRETVINVPFTENESMFGAFSYKQIICGAITLAAAGTEVYFMYNKVAMNVMLMIVSMTVVLLVCGTLVQVHGISLLNYYLRMLLQTSDVYKYSADDFYNEKVIDEDDFDNEFEDETDY